MSNTKAGVNSFALALMLTLAIGVVEATGIQDQQAVTVKQVVNQSGWEIPGLTDNEVVDPRKQLASAYGVRAVPLHITVLRPKRELMETIDLYGSKDGGETVVVRKRRVVIRSIIKCDVNGRVFLYLVQVGMVVYDPVSKKNGQSGLFGLAFYDNDGDGIFESRESGPFAVTPNLRIPDWVMINPRSP